MVKENGEPVTVKATLATRAPPPPLSASTRRSLYPPKQWSFFAFASLVLPLIFALGYISVHLHYELPEPRVEQFSPAGQPTFSEVSAMRYIRDLAAYADGTPKYRIVGTKEMVETDKYILDEIAAIREQVVRQHPEGGMQIEVFHQVRPACLLLFGQLCADSWTLVSSQIGDGTHVRPCLALIFAAALRTGFGINRLSILTCTYSFSTLWTRKYGRRSVGLFPSQPPLASQS